MRDNQYTIDGRIRFSEVDHTRRITLPGIVNYFQDCSSFHSEDLGVGIEYQKIWDLESNTAAKKSGHGSCHLGR